MTPSDYSWERREATHQHHRWFHRIVLVHELTLGWLEALNLGEKPHLMARGLSPEVTENLWMLEDLPKRSVVDFLDDTHPEDVLGRLEHTVWAAQAHVLSRLYERSASGIPALESILEQTSWKLGRKNAENHWKDLSETRQSDIQALLQAAIHSPLIPEPGSILVIRALPEEAHIELLSCVHELPYAEVSAHADRLCGFHGHWLRGYGYGLNHRLAIQSSVRDSRKTRCHQRWTLIYNPTP